MKKRTDKDSFGDKLGLDPEDKIEIELDDINVSSNGTKEDAKQDYIKLRESLIASLIRSQEIIDHTARDIKQGSSAMMVQSLSQLIKGVGDTAKVVLELHEKIRKLDEVKEEDKTNVEKKTIKTNLNDIIDMAKEREKRNLG